MISKFNVKTLRMVDFCFYLKCIHVISLCYIQIKVLHNKSYTHEILFQNLQIAGKSTCGEMRTPAKL